ncbi:MAG TPA: hypothetical protein VGA61_21540 [Anaerolineae bacterium]
MKTKLILAGVTVIACLLALMLPTQAANTFWSPPPLPDPSLTTPGGTRAEAYAISSVPFSTLIDGQKATYSQNGCYGYPNLSVWYSYTPSSPRVLRAELPYGQWANVTVYAGDSTFGFGCLGSGGNFEFMANAGTTYYFQISSYGFYPPYSVKFNLLDMGPPPELHLALNSVGAVNSRTGTATVGGTITCTAPLSVNYGGTLRQRVGKDIVSGQFYFSNLNCNGPTTWQAEVRSPSSAFSGGAAELSVSVQSYALNTNLVDSQTSTVQLRAARPR